MPGRVFLSMMPSPDRSGVVLQEQENLDNARPAQFILWRPSGASLLFDELANAGATSLFGRTVPPRGYVQIFAYEDGHNPGVEPPGAFHIFDVRQCQPGRCESRRIAPAGYPVWSPDGSQMLVWNIGGDDLYRGDANGAVLVTLGEGMSPFWIDERTYGYLRTGPGVVQVVVAAAADDKPQVLFTARDLEGLVPHAVLPGRILTLGRVSVSPSDPNRLFISAFLIDEAGTIMYSYIFSFDRETGKAALEMGPASTLVTHGVSPDGRWLEISTVDSARSTWSLHLREAYTGDSRQFAFAFSNAASLQESSQYDWSADGQWLAVLNDGVLHLIAPNQDYQYSVIPESAGCVFAAWMDREVR